MTAATAKPRTRKKGRGTAVAPRPQPFIDNSPFTPEPRDLAAELEHFRSHPSKVDNDGLVLFLQHLAEVILLPLSGREDLEDTLKETLNRNLDIISKITKQR